MDPIRRLRTVHLNRPVAIIGFEGWADASSVSSGTAEYLLFEGDEDPIAILESEDFFDFSEDRPIVSVIDGQVFNMSWPSTRVHHVNHDDRDLIVVTGPEPGLRWKTYARYLGAYLAELGVEKVVTVGAFVGQVPHTVPTPIFAVATDVGLLDRYNLVGSDYEGPTSIYSVIVESLREEGIPAVGLWGGCPHYLGSNTNPKVMLALINAVGRVLEMRIDATELSSLAGEFESRVDGALGQSTDLAEYVAELERAAVGMDEDDVEVLIDEVEEFLKRGQ
jgi:proteasome assembly chaperone (PAC2) family protein